MSGSLRISNGNLKELNYQNQNISLFWSRSAVAILYSALLVSALSLYSFRLPSPPKPYFKTSRLVDRCLPQLALALFSSNRRTLDSSPQILLQTLPRNQSFRRNLLSLLNLNMQNLHLLLIRQTCRRRNHGVFSNSGSLELSPEFSRLPVMLVMVRFCSSVY